MPNGFDEDFHKDVKQFVCNFPKRIDEYDCPSIIVSGAQLESELSQPKTQLPLIVGPALRGSGVAWDVRKATVRRLCRHGLRHSTR